MIVLIALKTVSFFHSLYYLAFSVCGCLINQISVFQSRLNFKKVRIYSNNTIFRQQPLYPPNSTPYFDIVVNYRAKWVSIESAQSVEFRFVFIIYF